MTEITVTLEQGALLDMAPYIESVVSQAGIDEPVRVKLGDARLRVGPGRVEVKQDGHWIDVPLVDDEEIPS